MLLESVCRLHSEILWFREINGKKFIFAFTIVDGNAFANGILSHHIAVNQVWYSEIEDHNTWLIYDPMYSLIECVDEPGHTKMYETTKVLLLDSNPDMVADKITDVIAKREAKTKEES